MAKCGLDEEVRKLESEYVFTARSQLEMQKSDFESFQENLASLSVRQGKDDLALWCWSSVLDVIAKHDDRTAEHLVDKIKEDLQ